MARCCHGKSARIPPGPQRGRIYRKRKCPRRLPLGGKPSRSAASIGCRSGPSAGRCDRRERRPRVGGCGQSADVDPDRLHGGRRPSPHGPRRQPRPAWRQSDRGELFSAELAAKRLDLLRELVPTANRVAVLLNPAEVAIAAANLRDVETAARAMALEIQVFNARTNSEIDATFAAIARERPDAVFISSGPLFTSRRVQLAHLATHHRIPAIHGSRFYPEVGGLISYGASVPDAHRQAGVYVGRILKGAKAADLPVVQRGNRCKKRPWNWAFRWPCATDVKYRRASGLEIATTPSSGDRGLAVCRQMGLTACVRLPELRCRLRVAELLCDPPVSLRAIG